MFAALFELFADERKDNSESTLSQHFKALREAGLIRVRTARSEMQNTTRCAEIDQRFPV